MQTKNPDLFRRIDQLGLHFTTNVSNKFLKDEFRALALDHRAWSDIESLTEKNGQFKYDGYYVDDLYIKLHSLAQFVQAARKLAPTLRGVVAAHGARRTPQERTLADIAVANFLPNLGILADQLNDIFTLLSREDAEGAHGRPTVLSKLPQVHDFGSLLIG